MTIVYTHFRIDGIRGVTFYDKNKVVDILPVTQLVRKFLEENADYKYDKLTIKDRKKYCKDNNMYV